MLEYYILEGKIVVPVESLDEWIERFEFHDDNRIVAQEDVGPYWVSTVFLGLDHRFMGHGPPLVFETMVFRDRTRRLLVDLWCRRCSTWEEAETTHAEGMAWAKEQLETETDELRTKTNPQADA